MTGTQKKQEGKPLQPKFIFLFEQMLNVAEELVIIKSVRSQKVFTKMKQLARRLFFHPSGTQNVYAGHKTSIIGAGVLTVVI